MPSVLLNHDFGGLDHGGDRIALFEFQFVGAPAGDRTLDQIVAYTDNHMGHDIAQLNLLDLSTQFVSG